MQTRLAWVLLGWTVVIASAGAEQKSDPVTWRKTVIDKAFRSEGVAVADVNKDGRLDILVGDLWYEAPDWKKHEIRKPGDFKDGASGYSRCFLCWADDINGDTWPDQIVVAGPGAAAFWYANPQGKDEPWKEHLLTKSANNETPQYVDLLGKGKRGLLMGNNGKVVWATPGKDATQPWELHDISGEKGPGAGGHGLGVGDVNGDGRLDVITVGGWYEQLPPVDGKPAWKLQATKIGDACADMFAYDVDGDGKADVLSSSAHHYGIWAHLQRSKDGSAPAFVKQDLFPKLFSQSHALHCLDINGDGVKDLVTGKRRWAHGPKGDVDAMDPPVLYWFEAKKGADGIVSFTPHKIDDASGVGTQFWVGDFNGDKRPDILVSNKMGVYLFEQGGK